ncbi:MAG: hypothetical protein WD801_13785 [Gemmatimonadaceae bacterium]
MRFLQRLRGIAATAMTWAVVWVPVSLIPFSVAALLGRSLPLRLFVTVAITQAVVGAICGATFATILLVAGRRRTFDTLSIPWIAACGAAGALLLPVIGRAIVLATIEVTVPMAAIVSTVITNGLLGAGLAAATLSIARRAPALSEGTAAERHPAYLPRNPTAVS